MLLPVVLNKQIVCDSFAFALKYHAYLVWAGRSSPDGLAGAPTVDDQVNVSFVTLDSTGAMTALGSKAVNLFE